MVKPREKTVLERYMLESPSWTEGYREFTRFFGKPLGWLFVLQNGSHRLIRLNQKGHCSFFAKSKENQTSCGAFLEKYFEQLSERKEEIDQFPNFYHCGFGRSGAIFALKHLGELKGFLILCAVGKSEHEIKPYLGLFDHFLQSEVDLAYKSFELQNFYETVHPRALALSTIHSVHRVLSSTLGLDQLIPRIGRLCSQVLKAKSCEVLLLDQTKTYLIPKFTSGEKITRKRRLKVGHGLEGRVAETAEFYHSRNCIAVPFIEDDVVGVVVLRDKLGGTPFTKTDLEILKTLSEQAVIAIKNAQLFEETEQLTLGSIKTINELLELSFAGENIYLPLFGEIAYQMGIDLGLSGHELTNLHRATFLIDAGQLGTPESILHKKEKLTRQEFEEVKRHPSRGAAILQQISSLRPITPIILHHHERYDGTGYPSRLKGEEIPIGARIVSVVDSFTAMLSRRPYRSGRTIKEAIQEIKANSGTQFDPKVVESFFKVIQRPEIVAMMKRLPQGSRTARKAKSIR
ncbi:MAG: HD domain-containing protein [Candidatus Omnitrophica bacterium]|nr:HD domain-containing protein [Candidatus Omnitrophota bacterium]